MKLVVKSVNKTYGTKKVVNDISFEIDKPGVYGLLGTNGAGKTTTIRMLLGIIKKDSGEITWNGKEVDRKNVNFGYLPEERGLYPKSKVFEQLVYFARLKGMSKNDAEESIKYWMNRLKVEEYKDMLSEKLSKGNQQKVQFILSIVHNPELIVLDEPFSGLDPVNTELLKEVILELVQKGKYIIMSSHQMTSIEEFCSDILILSRGNTVLQGNLRQIKDEYKATSIELRATQDVTKHIKELNLEIISNVDNEYKIKINDEKQGYELYKLLASKDIPVIKFELKKPSLHDIFIERVGK